MQTRRSPNVFMGFVVAFVVALFWRCCCVVVAAPPTVCDDFVVFLCPNQSKRNTSDTTFQTRRSPNVFIGFVVAFVVAWLLLRLTLPPPV